VKTLGDGLMAMFDSPAEAVARPTRCTSRSSASAHPAMAARPRRAVPLRLQVGLARGEVIEMSGDVFGDAVNVAARLIDHAGDNETLVTSSVLDALATVEQARFRSLDRMQLRGRVEPVHVYLLESMRRFGDTLRRPSATSRRLAAEPEGIRLVWLDQNRIYAGTSLPVILGPQPPGDLHHRRHARLAIACAHRVARRHVPAHRPQLQRHLCALRPRSRGHQPAPRQLHAAWQRADRPGRPRPPTRRARACASRS
jgi:hypothetical protein